jgi:hypothetical protein
MKFLATEKNKTVIFEHSWFVAIQGFQSLAAHIT